MSKKPQSSKKRAASSEQKPKRKPGELSTFQKVVIILFVVVFALSTLAGALASVFQSQHASQTVEYNVEYVDEQYEPLIADLEAKVAEDPDDMESVLSLANDYSSWGTSVMMLATTDEESTHADDLLEKAMGYYDQYLASDDPENADAARVSRAMCLNYQGDTSAAIEELEGVTQDSPDFAPAWADLGMLYETSGETEDAVAAYEKAIELDPDDEQGVKSVVEERLNSLTGSDEETSDDASSDEASDDASDGSTSGDSDN